MSWQASEGRCRVCGSLQRAWDANAAEFGNGCSKCGGSPLCASCGHARRRHTGLYSTVAKRGCKDSEYDVQTLSRTACACPGYAPLTRDFGDAEFAASAPQPDLDEPLSRLRVVDPPQA